MLRQRCQVFDDFGDQFGQTNHLVTVLVLPGLISGGQHQKLIDQLAAIAQRLVDGVEKVVLEFVSALVALTKIDLRGHDRKGGTQVVRGVGDEFFIGGQGLSEPFSVIVERVDNGFQFGRRGIKLKPVQRTRFALR